MEQFKTCKEYLPVTDELCSIGHLVLRGTRIVILKTLRESIPKLGHEGYPGRVRQNNAWDQNAGGQTWTRM